MTTTEQLLEVLEKVNESSPCSECQELAGKYIDKILTVQSRERILDSIEHEEEIKRARNFLAMRVKLETVTARRFMLHILKGTTND